MVGHLEPIYLPVGNEKIIIYQIFTRIFGNHNSTHKPYGSIEENGVGKFSELSTPVLRRIKKLGVTHIWCMGVIRHATVTDYSACGIPKQNAKVVKGVAGSPYAITDYYDVDPDLAENVDKRMDEFLTLLKRAHREGLRVVIDFVPNHVARQYHSICKPEGVEDLGEGDDTSKHFSTENNFYYCPSEPLSLDFDTPQTDEQYVEMPAKATGNDVFSAHPSKNDWYETVKLNYGVDYCDFGGRSEHFSPVPSTWRKMTDILLFWASKGVDGFRCDMAEMVPAPFWHYATERLKASYPEIIVIGEVYNPALYRQYLASGFDYLYDKVGMYDCLKAVVQERCPASCISEQWQSVDDIKEHMLYFLENHDEQRIASDFFIGDPAKGVPMLVVAALLLGNPFMLYAGQEFGERGMDAEGFSGRDGRTTIFDYWSIGALHRGYYDRRSMLKSEKLIESLYLKVLNIAAKEKAVKDGKFFDLMYCNRHLGDRQYAFLRKKDDEMLIVVVNFSDFEALSELVIPEHAFSYLNIKSGEYAAADLMTGKAHEISLQRDGRISLIVKANWAVVLKVKC